MKDEMKENGCKKMSENRERIETNVIKLYERLIEDNKD